MAADKGYTPAAATAQEPPALAVACTTSRSALFPPTRSVEPWTEEQWFFQFRQPSSSDNHITGGLITAGYYQWPGIIGLGESERPWSPVPQQPLTSPRVYRDYSAGTQVDLNTYGYMRQPRLFTHHTVCPRALYSPRCTPMDVPIAPNDTCRQATLWPPQWEDPGRGMFASADHGAVSPGACPLIPHTGPSLANRSVFEQDYAVAQATTAVGVVEQYFSFRGGSQQEHIAHQGNRWHQVVSVTYPPGTVAVLPTNGSRLLHLGYPQTGYPWRLNRVPVTQTMMDTVPTMDIGHSLEASTVVCSSEKGGTEPVLVAAIVLLDDPSCVQARNCSPTVALGAGTNDHSFDNKLQWSQSAISAASQSWMDAQKALPAWRRAGKLGCASLYSVNTSEYNIDLVHFDYPAATSTRAVTIGGEFRRAYPPSHGAWRPPISRLRGPRASPSLNGSATPLQDPVSPAWSLPQEMISPLIGPFARYRGVRLDRIIPGAALQQLPVVNGGGWECNDTSLIGAFQYRPVCRAKCNDPDHVPVDLVMEPSPTGRPTGWAMAASVSRVWSSAWSGSPPLPVNGATASHNGAEHTLTCVNDRGKGVELSFSAAWAQREQSSTALVHFTLDFDRNMWPQAQVMTPQPAAPPGLQYPEPSPDQLHHLSAELGADIADLLGEWDADQGRNVSLDTRRIEPLIMGIRAHPPQWPIGDLPTDRPEAASSQQSLTKLQPSVHPPVIRMEIDVKVRLRPLPAVQVLGVPQQRTRSAGALAQRLVRLLRAGQLPGGVWLPVVNASSARLEVRLPCLREGSASRWDRCPAAQLSASPWAWCTVAVGLLCVVGAVGQCVHQSFCMVDKDPAGLSSVLLGEDQDSSGGQGVGSSDVSLVCTLDLIAAAGVARAMGYILLALSLIAADLSGAGAVLVVAAGLGGACRAILTCMGHDATSMLIELLGQGSRFASDAQLTAIHPAAQSGPKYRLAMQGRNSPRSFHAGTDSLHFLPQHPNTGAAALDSGASPVVPSSRLRSSGAPSESDMRVHSQVAGGCILAVDTGPMVQSMDSSGGSLEPQTDCVAELVHAQEQAYKHDRADALMAHPSAASGKSMQYNRVRSSGETSSRQHLIDGHWLPLARAKTPSKSSIVAMRLVSLLAWDAGPSHMLMLLGGTGGLAGWATNPVQEWVGRVRVQSIAVRLLEDLGLFAALSLGGWCTSMQDPASAGFCAVARHESPARELLDARLWLWERGILVGGPLVLSMLGILWSASLTLWVAARYAQQSRHLGAESVARTGST